MSNSACENEQKPITEHFQPDAPYARELRSDQCDQNKDGQPSSQLPCAGQRTLLIRLCTEPQH